MPTEIPQAVVDYLASQNTVTLATASPEGTPHARTFMYVNDGVSFYFWARPNTKTAQHVQDNPRVSFAIDEYVSDWNKAKGIQGDGTCERVGAGDEMGRVVGLFAEKFPSPTSSASTANISFFKVTPSSLQLIDNSGGQTSFSAEEFGMNFHREAVL